jgi:hypothetical protein
LPVLYVCRVCVWGVEDGRQGVGVQHPRVPGRTTTSRVAHRRERTTTTNRKKHCCCCCCRRQPRTNPLCSPQRVRTLSAHAVLRRRRWHRCQARLEGVSSRAAAAAQQDTAARASCTPMPATHAHHPHTALASPMPGR